MAAATDPQYHHTVFQMLSSGGICDGRKHASCWLGKIIRSIRSNYHDSIHLLLKGMSLLMDRIL